MENTYVRYFLSNTKWKNDVAAEYSLNVYPIIPRVGEYIDLPEEIFVNNYSYDDYCEFDYWEVVEVQHFPHCGCYGVGLIDIYIEGGFDDEGDE